MSFVVLFVAGALVAAAFDWMLAYAANAYRLETKRERRDAFVVCFALHGPWFALGFPTIFGGLIDRLLIAIGLSPQVAWFAMLPLFAVAAGAMVLLVGRVPTVRAAKVAVWDKMRSAQRRQNEKFGSFLGFPMGEKKPPTSEIDR